MQESPETKLPFQIWITEAETQALKAWLQTQGTAENAVKLRGTMHGKDGADFPVDFEVTGVDEAGGEDKNEPRIAVAAADQAKLDALAIVAQGMGHEINNPLQIIMSHVELLMLSSPNAEQLSGLQEILYAGERIKAVVANLKDFIRPQEK